jgi:hypothetical protein
VLVGLRQNMYRIDNLVKASTCNIVGTASIDCQNPLVADVGIFANVTTRGREREEEGRKGEDWLSKVSKLATVALPIYSNPYKHNPPMKEHSMCLRDRAASSFIYYKISIDERD